MMLFINLQDGGPLQAAINRNSTSMFIFYVMIAFAITKMVAAGRIQEKFKIEFERQMSGSISDDDSYYMRQQNPNNEVPYQQPPPHIPHMQASNSQSHIDPQQQQWREQNYNHRRNMSEEEMRYQEQ